MLFQYIALHGIGPGLQVIQRGIPGVARELFGEQLNGGLRLIVLQ